jgi:hypothetical protein
MMKLIVLLCYISNGQCDWLPWTNNLNGPLVGSPVIYETQGDCERAGNWLLMNHNGNYANRPPGYNIHRYRCEPL